MAQTPQTPPQDDAPRPRALSDPPFYLLLSLGVVALFVPGTGYEMGWALLAAKALLEELIFRGLLQDALTRRLPRLPGPVSAGNLAASLLFAGLHLVNHSTPWALATFFPSLVFGLAWDRYHRLWPVWLLHFSYNLVLFNQARIIHLLR